MKLSRQASILVLSKTGFPSSRLGDVENLNNAIVISFFFLRVRQSHGSLHYLSTRIDLQTATMLIESLPSTLKVELYVGCVTVENAPLFC